MKKLSTIFSLMSVFVFGVMVFAQRAYADVIMPGQDPSSHGGWRRHDPIIESQLPTYIITGIVIIIVIIISVIILNKIRKRK